MASRETLMRRIASAFRSVETFDARSRNPRYFAPVMLCARDHAKRELERLTNQCVRQFPQVWTEAEQAFLRPL